MFSKGFVVILDSWDWSRCVAMDLDGAGHVDAEHIGSTPDPYFVANAERGVKMALALLLSPEGRWHGRRVVVLGSYDSMLDRPLDLEIASLVRSGARRPTVGSEPSIGPMVRRLLDRLEAVTYRTSRSPGGLQWSPPASPPSVVVNEDQGLHLVPAAFGDGPEILTFASAPGGGVMAALTVLLMAPVRRDDERFPGVHPLVGSWVGDRISIRPDTGVHETVDASAEVRRMMGRYFTFWQKPGSETIERLLTAKRPGEHFWPGPLAPPRAEWVL